MQREQNDSRSSWIYASVYSLLLERKLAVRPLERQFAQLFYCEDVLVTLFISILLHHESQLKKNMMLFEHNELETNNLIVILFWSVIFQFITIKTIN